MPDMPDLATFVADGWNRHAEQPQALASDLADRAATLAADPAAADALGLAEHVWLSYLGDEAGLAAFLDAAAPPGTEGPAAAAALCSRWALAQLRGDPTAPAPPPAARWRALQNVWTRRVQQGATAAVRAELAAESAAAEAHPEAADRRGLAATCNNLALELRLGPRGDAARDALMLDLARASRALWATAGTWVHAERADSQLAHCHAVLGQRAEALAHARACLAAIEAHADAPEADAFERFFAHEALVEAHRAAGDGAAAADQRARMIACRDRIDDPGLRAWADEALAALGP